MGLWLLSIETFPFKCFHRKKIQPATCSQAIYGNEEEVPTRSYILIRNDEKCLIADAPNCFFRSLERFRHNETRSRSRNSCNGSDFKPLFADLINILCTTSHSLRKKHETWQMKSFWRLCSLRDLISSLLLQISPKIHFGNSTRIKNHFDLKFIE